MLPTPDTSHVSFDTIYEPAEDSYLFLDTLSSESESKWLSERFKKLDHSSLSSPSNSAPLVVEVGTGSGVVLAFAAAQSRHIFGRQDILTLGVDVNRNACIATRDTVSAAIKSEQQKPGLHTIHISSITSDLCTALRPGSVDVLIFNPPYVPTEELPRLPTETENDPATSQSMSRSAKFESDSFFLSLTYAGGADGMETTNRLLEAIPDILSSRGVAYVLLCKQNRPDEVKERICAWGGWNAETVGSSGMQAGWEKLSRHPAYLLGDHIVGHADVQPGNLVVNGPMPGRSLAGSLPNKHEDFKKNQGGTRQKALERPHASKGSRPLPYQSR